VALTAQAAPDADLWPRWQAHDPGSTRTIDHSRWASFLDEYLVIGHSSGVNRVRYAEVSRTDANSLDAYVARLQRVSVSGLDRDEQFAFWVNLYNAYTVKLILDYYPVESIRDIDLSGLFTRGPWDKKLMEVEGEELSLNDIEHRILRPIWQDPRIHYVVNCASIGCPNLPPDPLTASNLENVLERAADEYINHPRGASVEGNMLYLSSIYDWYEEDFDGSLEGVKDHILEYAERALAREIRNHDGRVRYRYDWALNEP
jgi:hypothetical protein